MSFLVKKIFFLIRLFICGGMSNFAAKFGTAKNINKLIHKHLIKYYGRKEIFDMRR